MELKLSRGGRDIFEHPTPVGAIVGLLKEEGASRAWMVQNEFAPIRRDEDGIVVAFADPTNRSHVDAAEFVFGERITVAIASRSAIMLALSKLDAKAAAAGIGTVAEHRLMQNWNIPEVYARVVKHHHDEGYDETDSLTSLIRLVDMACNRLGIGIGAPIDLNLAASTEAQRLRASEVALAELEIHLEDAMQLSH